MQEEVARLTRRLEQKKFGKFRGVVTDNQDPEKLGRLKLRIASLLGDQESDWALPCTPFGGGSTYGWFAMPEVDAQVWVEFEEGDVSRPIWTGSFWLQADQVPEDAAKDEPTTRMLQTPAGHILQFDDADDDTRIRLFHPQESEVILDKDGGIALTDSTGATVFLDAAASELTVEDNNGNSIKMTASGTVVEDSNGNKIEMAAAGTTVEGQQVVIKGSQVMLAGQGGEPIIKGQSFLTLFATHMHPTTMGPSGPPIPQGEMSTLSMKVLTS